MVEILKRFMRYLIEPRFGVLMAIVFMYSYGKLVEGSVWGFAIIFLVGATIDLVLSAFYELEVFDPKEDS